MDEEHFGIFLGIPNRISFAWASFLIKPLRTAECVTANVVCSWSIPKIVLKLNPR